VRELLDQASEGQHQILMNWINIGEVVHMLVRKRSQEASEDFLTRLPSLPIRLVLPTADSIVRAARIQSKSRLSYADAMAVELAVQHKTGIVTGDPEIAALGLATVVWVGP
jgi:predicted nucleic acid-binding protein